MSRKKLVIKKRVSRDRKYNSPIIGQFICMLMKDGKKGLAESILYGAFDIIHERMKEDPLVIFNKAVENVKPKLEVKARRVGGATYQVPIDVRYERRISLGLRWITKYARQRREKTMQEKLALELMDAYNKTGGAMKKLVETHKMAEANQAFSHFKW